MKWEKMGLIYVPKGDLWWSKAYTHAPTPEVINDEFIRVYYDSLDENKFGRIGYVDLDINDPTKILYLSKKPVLDIGEIGMFDDCGVNPSCIINVNNEKRLYYIGWQRAERVPYMFYTGLAVSKDEGKTFEKYSKVPILDRTDHDPLSVATLFVMIENHVFKGWYFSCTEWTVEEGRVRYNNVIKYAESEDGIHWKTTDHICVAPEGGYDYAIGRPWVVKDGTVYKMWYSIRSTKKSKEYRIGYAESTDGIVWEKKDNAVGIDVSKTGWDSEMICFPCVVDAKGRRYMFYSGNRFGRGGFGYAVLESD